MDSWTCTYVHVFLTTASSSQQDGRCDGQRARAGSRRTKLAARYAEANTASAPGILSQHTAEHIAKPVSAALHTHSSEKCCSKNTCHLLLGDINDTDPDVRAPLGNHSHRWASDIPGAHAADVVLELFGRHGGSCGGGRGWRRGRVSYFFSRRCVKENKRELGTYDVEQLRPCASRGHPPVSLIDSLRHEI